MEMITFTIRVPLQLNEWLDYRAALNNRSKNKEVTMLLESARDENACKGGYHYQVGDRCACGRFVMVKE